MSIARRFASVRSIRPAATRSTSVAATCRTTSVSRVARLDPPTARASVLLQRSRTDARAACSAGTMLNSRPVRSEARNEKPIRRQSSAEIVTVAHADGHQLFEQRTGERRKREPEQAAEKRKGHPFDHHLADEPSAARAERHTHRELAAASGGARQEQARQVRAGDQQRRSRGRHQYD